MWGTAKKRPPVGTGMADPRATEVVGDRTGGVWLILANRWTSAIASNCAEYSAGKRWKAPRSEDDGDTTMPYARCIASMTTPATAQWYALRTGFLSGCATPRAMCLCAVFMHITAHGAVARENTFPMAQYAPGRIPPSSRRVDGTAGGDDE